MHRHVRSFLLELVENELPARMGEFLDDLRLPTRWKSEGLQALFQEVQARRDELIDQVVGLFERDRKVGRISAFDALEASGIVENFEGELTQKLDGWWERVKQLDKEFREYSTVGSPRQDERKAAARKRAYHEITQDPERAYGQDGSDDSRRANTSLHGKSSTRGTVRAGPHSSFSRTDSRHRLSCYHYPRAAMP